MLFRCGTTPLQASGAYPHDPALRWFTRSSLAGFAARASMQATCAPAHRRLALFSSGPDSGRLKTVHSAESPGGLQGLCLSIVRRSAPISSHRPGAITSLWWVHQF